MIKIWKPKFPVRIWFTLVLLFIIGYIALGILYSFLSEDYAPVIQGGRGILALLTVLLLFLGVYRFIVFLFPIVAQIFLFGEEEVQVAKDASKDIIPVKEENLPPAFELEIPIEAKPVIDLVAHIEHLDKTQDQLNKIVGDLVVRNRTVSKLVLGTARRIRDEKKRLVTYQEILTMTEWDDFDLKILGRYVTKRVDPAITAFYALAMNEETMQDGVNLLQNMLEGTEDVIDGLISLAQVLANQLEEALRICEIKKVELEGLRGYNQFLGVQSRVADSHKVLVNLLEEAKLVGYTATEVLDTTQEIMAPALSSGSNGITPSAAKLLERTT